MYEMNSNKSSKDYVRYTSSRSNNITLLILC